MIQVLALGGIAERTVTLAAIFLSGLPVFSGLLSDIDVMPQGHAFVLQRNEYISLRCTATVELTRLEEVFVQPSDFTLEWLAVGQLIRREKLYLNRVSSQVLQGETVLRVHHDVSVTHREYVCTLKQGDQAVLENKACVVIMGNPPVSPKTVYSIHEKHTIIVSAYTPLERYIYNTLNTSHRVSIRGYNCSTEKVAEIWNYFNSCLTADRGEEHTILCKVSISEESKLTKCTHYQGVLVVENAFGQAQSDPFLVQRAVDLEHKWALSLRLASSTANSLRFDIICMDDELPLHDTIFQIKYRNLNDRTYWTQLTAPNAKDVLQTGLSPNECIYVSISSKIDVVGLNEDFFQWMDWTAEKVACTLPEVIRQVPLDFACREVPQSGRNLREPTTIQLTWKIPDLENEYGNVTHFMLAMEIINLRNFVNISIEKSAAKVQKFYSKRVEYMIGGSFIYRIALCNVVGCSKNYSSCSIELEGNSQRSGFPPAEVHHSWIVISVVVPVATIVALIVYAFASYYTKNEDKADLHEFDKIFRNSHSVNKEELISSPTPSVEEAVKPEQNGGVRRQAPAKRKHFVDETATSTESLDDLDEKQTDMQLKVIQTLFKPNKPNKKVTFEADDSMI